jgi:hypothetical protein
MYDLLSKGSQARMTDVFKRHCSDLEIGRS